MTTYLQGANALRDLHPNQLGNKPQNLLAGKIVNELLPGEKQAGFTNHTLTHKHKNHEYHAHNRFADDLRRSIDHFMDAQETYANALLFPEVALGRIPFICPVPTAVCRGTAVYSFTPDDPPVGSTNPHDTFAWTFIPEALLVSHGDETKHEPFHYGTGDSTQDVIVLTSCKSASALLPNIQFSSMSAARIVGASVIITQTQRLVDRAGYGQCSRVYGMNNSGAPVNFNVSRTTVMNAIYKDECNFSDPSNKSELRMVYAPGDFSDLHMRVMGTGSGAYQPDMET